MSGSFGELGSLLKQAQQMQRDLDRVREELRSTVVEGLAPNGLVRVQVTCDRQVSKVEIAAELVAERDRAKLEETLLAALRDGMSKATQKATEELGRVTGGVHLPGLF